MQTNLTVGDVTAGFEIIEIRELEELKALGIRARHIASGAEVAHIYNDDEENLFSFAFATPVDDSTGVAHILEHSVLCGSRSYPLKDAFIVLSQGSLQTFLNAMTFPDKTVYPASTTNRQDYYNLMAVYGDAVFRPLLEEWTFRQEGHRLEFAPAEDGPQAGDAAPRLVRTGVVYNEMKGNYSSADGIAADWAFRALLPDTPYAHDSGGDPDEIPNLSWEGLTAFHKSRYAPANCRIFLSGNIPTEEQLAFLNERFLSTLPAGSPVPPVSAAERWNESRRLSVPYPASPGQKSTVLLSWLCSDSTDAAESLALAALTETLMGHDGSPLTRALVESRLGEDLAPASGLEGELRETVFTAGLRGVAAEDAEKVERLILDTLERLAREGIPAEEVEAALLALEFSNREIRRSGGPFSLVWLRRSLRGWIHGAGPWATLLFVPPFQELKRRLAEQEGYLESLIRRYLLSNPHRALISVDPEEGLSERKDATLAAELERTAAALSEGERQEIKAAQAELERIQSGGDSPEALKTIPHISRSDLSPEVETVPRTMRDAAGVPVLAHDLFTNGITYLDFAFPVDILAPEDYLWLPLLSRSITALGLPGLDYGQVSGLMARTVGGFHAFLHSSSPAPGSARAAAVPSGILDLVGRDWLVFRLKALDEKVEGALDLARRMMTEADYGDHRRLTDLVLEFRNDFDASLAPSGHSYAMARSGRRFSRSRAVEELWNGLSQLEALHRAAELPIAETAAKLASLRDRLVSSAGLILNITGSAGAIDHAAEAAASRFYSFGAPRPRSPACAGAEPFFALADQGAAGSEVHASASLQVGFAALAVPAAPFATAEQAAELVLAHRLSTGALWEDIRMRGGAYGAFAYPDGLEPLFLMATYRDPKPRRSLSALADALRAAAAETVDAEELEKAIIGSYSKETRPRTGAEKGMADFMRFLTGIEHAARQRKLAALVGLQGTELRAAAERLAAGLESASYAVVAGNGAAAEAAEALAVAPKPLPA